MSFDSVYSNVRLLSVPAAPHFLGECFMCRRATRLWCSWCCSATSVCNTTLSQILTRLQRLRDCCTLRRWKWRGLLVDARHSCALCGIILSAAHLATSARDWWLRRRDIDAHPIKQAREHTLIVLTRPCAHSTSTATISDSCFISAALTD